MEKKEIKLLMLGLVGAGKHTILYKLRQKDNDRPIPTIGFNVETMECQNNIYAVWHRNIGGQDKIRPIWRHFFQNIKGLIFVIDSGMNHCFWTEPSVCHSPLCGLAILGFLCMVFLIDLLIYP